MRAAIEPASAILRVYADGATPGRDPYIFSATIVFHDLGAVAELRGAINGGGGDILAIRRAVFSTLRSAGVERVRWERRRNGRRRFVSVEIRRAAPE